VTDRIIRAGAYAGRVARVDERVQRRRGKVGGQVNQVQPVLETKRARETSMKSTAKLQGLDDYHGGCPSGAGARVA
jgi:hypothetical protein